MSKKAGQTFNTEASTYQPYNAKDYKNLKNQNESQKLGGLGANIGGEAWERA